MEQLWVDDKPAEALAYIPPAPEEDPNTGHLSM